MKEHLLVTFEIKASRKVRIRDLKAALDSTTAEDICDAVAEQAAEMGYGDTDFQVDVRTKIQRLK